jgi:hypothetical protein
MRTLLVLPFLAFSLAACQDDPAPRSDEHAPDRSTAPSRSRERILASSCGDGSRERCLGGYPFTVREDGTYRVGPGPDGQVLEGRLDPADAATLAGAGDDEAALRRVAGKYYPLPFPNPCVNALAELESVFASVLPCESDDECALIGSDLVPVDAGRPAARVDACSYLPTLVAANAYWAVSRQLQLVLTRRLAATVCGPALLRPYCSPDARGPEGRRAACVQSRCVAAQ